MAQRIRRSPCENSVAMSVSYSIVLICLCLSFLIKERGAPFVQITPSGQLLPSFATQNSRCPRPIGSEHSAFLSRMIPLPISGRVAV